MKQKTYIETGVLFKVINTGEEFHSFHDLNLVLAPFTYTPAQPKLNLIDIPGGDGTIDFTEALGEVKYNDREFTFTFSVFPGDEMAFEERQSFVSAALNGKRCYITLDKDSDYYWEGRCTVSEYLCDKRLCKIVIKATVKPYKTHYATSSTFELTRTAQEYVVVNNGQKSVIPTFTVPVGVVLTYGDVIKNKVLATGTYTIPEFRLEPGQNTFQARYVSASGALTLTFEEAVL